MKALQLTKYGGDDAIRFTAIADPSPREGEVLVEVRAAGVNPIDRILREGYMKDMMPLQFPAILGADFSGTIRELGPGITGYAAGDQVFGLANLARQGSFAELLPVGINAITAMPKSLSFTEAAAVPLAGLNAWRALVKQAHVERGHTVLIHGGAGGIGTFAIQIAKHLGARVLTTVRGAHEQYARSLGADEVIDFEKEDFAARLRGVDVVFDLVGGEVYQKSFRVLTSGGTIVSMKEMPNTQLASQHGVTALMQNTQPNARDLESLRDLIEQGVLKPHIDRTFTLADGAAALTYQFSGHPQGKVVIKVRD